MSAAERRRRARFIAAELIISDVEAGMDVASYTETGSDAETQALADEILAVADRVRRSLPEGYRIGLHPDDRKQAREGP